MRAILRTAWKYLWPQGKHRWLKRASIFLVIFGVLNVAAVETTSQSWFCNSCHIMNPYYSTWKVGTHKDVECVKCHIPPGFDNFVSAKLNGAGQVVDDILSRTNTKPSAVVSDASCTRSGCHNIETVKAKVIDKKFKFEHGKHLGLEYRGIAVHCTTCHSHIKADSHFAVNLTTCITCHTNGPDAPPPSGTQLVSWTRPSTSPAPAEPVKTAAVPAESEGAKVSPVLATGTSTGEDHKKLFAPKQCKACHNPPEREISYHGLRVQHSEYLQYGAACESCHTGVTEKSRPIRDEQCYSCHEFGMEKLGSVDETHRVHTGAGGHHKVECFNCHGISQHGPLAQKAQNDQLVCQTCHQQQHAIQQSNYKREEGDGMVLSPATSPTTWVNSTRAVSPMFMAHVACSGCHINPQPERNRPGSGATVKLASAKACDNCHKPGASEQVPLWQRSTKTMFEGVTKMLPPPERQLDERQKKLVANAKELLDLVRVDGSWGVHNPRYTQRLLEQAQKDLSELGPAPKVEATP